ncbi:uncharacterized protein LOC128958297 [Oppia nitens]|uniref:uncharacterized protein LOC128958297 n=1 Tax=Oppia nitens TaxID=1686743 RepID=UPI0023D991B5|nr:uncharacterized protein LOC128958297 [Oppia nitens]XP_054160089.1 uncharacterized protein LOC128958297 [Oppia nitens]
MYSVSKEHKGNKIFAKTRRGIPQKLDNLDNNSRDNTNNGFRKDMNGLHMNDCLSQTPSPRPVFHMNGRKTYHQRNSNESISAQHWEMIQYIHESWKCVKRDLESSLRHSMVGGSGGGGDHSKSSSMKPVPQISYYKLDKSSHIPKFEPFDLETFWGQRLFQNITQST